MTNTLKINDKEYELKINYKAVKHLNGIYEGGALELIGKALQGDLDTFEIVVHAALLHTGENFALGTISEAIEQAVDEGQFDDDKIRKTLHGLVTGNSFYRVTAEKFLTQDKQMKQTIELLLK